MADKLKRLRVHVVKEIYDTERDYTRSLEFTVTHILGKAIEKGHHDNSFTEDIIATLFCNITDILELHRDLVKELDSCIYPKGPAYESQVARCFLKHRERFSTYRQYGEKNETAQKLLYELQDRPEFKAFFVACMLLGGKGDADISSLIFQPIQRVCKYPLLFRELEKYTPAGHPDRKATEEGLAMMRDTCSVINEAKRRVEHLEHVADWQATVEEWEGSNVVDTCNQLIKEGPLIKISAGNTQERMFFLFDNLLVYCKKSLLSRGKSLLFRGRIAVEGLDIENIEDGTADYYTNGIMVNNSWKVHNVAKNKWFVLIAKSADDKQQWMDAIRREKEKRKRLAAGIARDTRKLILDRGEKIYHLMKRGQVMRDHRARLKTYTQSFSGEELVQWLVEQREVGNADEAVIFGQALLEHGMIHHVSDKHQFKKAEYLYRFRYDDGTYRGKLESSDVMARGIRIYCRLHGLFDPLLKEHKLNLRAMRAVISSQRLIDFWISEKDIHNRAEGVALGQELFATGVLRHATDEQNFRDGAHLYKFLADDGHEGGGVKDRRVSALPSRLDFRSTNLLSCISLMVPFCAETRSYGLELMINQRPPLIVKSASPETQLCGVSVGHKVLSLNGQVMDRPISEGELEVILKPTIKNPPPLHVVLSKNSSEYHTLVSAAGGLGFHIRGSSPVIIDNIDKGSATAQAGIIPACAIFKVGEAEVLRSTHDVVVACIKRSLDETASQDGGPSVKLKVSFPFVEQLTTYKYEENVNGTVVDLYERTVESPYTFSVPGELLKLYAKEVDSVLSLLAGYDLSDAKITQYLSDLKTMGSLYSKTYSVLKDPRWPSYKLSGTGPQSPVFDACPTNLHTSILDVVALDPASSPPPSSSPSASLTSSFSSIISEDENGTPPSFTHTTYCTTTCAIPAASKTVTKAEKRFSEDSGLRRELLYDIHSRLYELQKDHESIKKMVLELRSSNPVSNGVGLGPTLKVPAVIHDDFTPTTSPTNSPTLPRHRILSISNPAPVLKLVARGMVQKVSSLVEFLEGKVMMSVMEEANSHIRKPVKEVLAVLKERVQALSKEVEVCAKKPGDALTRSVTIFFETVKKHTQELCAFLWTSLALCESVELLQVTDKLFTQCLVSIITSFSHHLVAAIKGWLNPEVSYEPSSAEASTHWLQLVASKGLLVHLQANMIPTDDGEFASLNNLSFIMKQLEKVNLHVREATRKADPANALNTELPPISLDGDRSELHVTFHLHSAHYAKLPPSLQSTQTVKLQPVLFNKGLVEIEAGTAAYSMEQSLNNDSLLRLKNYYRSLRAFRLDKSHLPQDSDAKLLAIHQISQPLNAMDILMRQIEVAIREPARPGVGLLTLTAELATRMGALRINMCESGVVRCSMSTTLEQVMVLARCHGLPLRNFRTALNILRRKGGYSLILRKNKTDISSALPKLPPKLYQLPPDTST